MIRRVGAVVIGRNEGVRLERALTSVLEQVSHCVYVDSGSTDGSVEGARRKGVSVVQLDSSLPFSAARARNVGVDRLVAEYPDAAFVQFVDGDCELVAGWISRALDCISADSGLAAVCGRRRERFPEASVYNLLCDIEWNTPVGEAFAFGGDALVRLSAFREAGGFNPAMIAGEEPELCVRLHAEGWRVRRLPDDMTWHDAAMRRFREWWRRALRAGHAYAHGAYLQGRGLEHLFLREAASLVCWGALVPFVALTGSPVTEGLSLALFGGYPVIAARAYARMRARGFSQREGLAYAAHCVAAKLPGFLGFLRFHYLRLRGRRHSLIEYKGARGRERAGAELEESRVQG